MLDNRRVIMGNESLIAAFWLSLSVFLSPLSSLSPAQMESSGRRSSYDLLRWDCRLWNESCLMERRPRTDLRRERCNAVFNRNVRLGLASKAGENESGRECSLNWRIWVRQKIVCFWTSPEETTEFPLKLRRVWFSAGLSHHLERDLCFGVSVTDGPRVVINEWIASAETQIKNNSGRTSNWQLY